MKRLLSLGMVCCAFACLAGAANAQGVVFKYKYKPGGKDIYRTKSTANQTQKVGEMKFENVMETTEFYETRLKQFDNDKNFVLERENKRYLIKMKIGPLGEYKYDSTADDNEKGSMLGGELTPLYDTLKGAIITVTQNPNGKIEKVKGYKELLEPILKDKPIAKQFSAGGTDKAMALGVGEFFPQFSDKPVKPGDSWEIPFKMSLDKLGSFEGKKVIKYVGPDKLNGKKTDKFTYSTELAIKVDLEQGGAKVTGELSISKSSGTFHFDRDKGIILSLKASQELSGDLTVTANGNDIGVSQSQKQSYELEHLEKLPD